MQIVLLVHNLLFCLRSFYKIADKMLQRHLLVLNNVVTSDYSLKKCSAVSYTFKQVLLSPYHCRILIFIAGGVY